MPPPGAAHRHQALPGAHRALGHYIPMAGHGRCVSAEDSARARPSRLALPPLQRASRSVEGSRSRERSGADLQHYIEASGGACTGTCPLRRIQRGLALCIPPERAVCYERSTHPHVSPRRVCGRVAPARSQRTSHDFMQQNPIATCARLFDVSCQLLCWESSLRSITVVTRITVLRIATVRFIRYSNHNLRAYG